MLKIENGKWGPAFKPLEKVKVTDTPKGILVARDGQRREYARLRGGRNISFAAAGALGKHTLSLEDETGTPIAETAFKVDAETEIKDRHGKYEELLNMLYWTMVGWHGETGTVRYKGKFYHYFVRWLRDHVHTLKGMKYFYPELKTGIDLYAGSQREDGMIWDNIYPRTRHKNMWDNRFSYGGFIRPFPDYTYEFKRIPVENDVEYLFVEGLYYTWKATGDTGWMAGLLDNAIKAYSYSATDPYRWSKKYKLLKRGYTIDTWDFQSAEDTAITGDAMVVDIKKTRFGVMHGDNTGFAAGCRYLAEMLDSAGREKEAARFRRMGEDIMKRLNKLAWNGRFFTHHVPEDRRIKRDLGVDESRQVSLSNSYSLNRTVTHDQAVKIIKTYQDIRRRMPRSSPGEWYQIFPIFQKGFGGHNRHWEYMNGGVTTIVAGELAHGAFEHGFEGYGTDILNRLFDLGKKYNNYFPCTFRGKMPEPPKRKFTTLNLKNAANTDLSGKGAKGVPGWTGEGDNDFHAFPTGKQTFNGIPFDIVKPAKNGRRACLGISRFPGYASEMRVPAERKAKSIYLLHTMGRGDVAGTVTLRYQDGSEHTQYIRRGREIGGWWGADDPPFNRHDKQRCKVAWRGANAHCCCIGCYNYGLDNPHPGKVIKEIVFEAGREACDWMVLGVTLCDKEVYFGHSGVSFGIPDNWGAAAVVYALVEGLAGVKDTGTGFDKVLLTPRWTAAEVDNASATIKYPASDGYVSYKYSCNKKTKKMRLEFTGNAEKTDLAVLLPSARKPKSVKLDGKERPFKMKKVEKSAYACLSAAGPAAHKLEIALA